MEVKGRGHGSDWIFFRRANSKQKKKKMKRKAKSNEKNFQNRLGTAWENEN
jgi:hypothetical protein